MVAGMPGREDRRIDPSPNGHATLNLDGISARLQQPAHRVSPGRGVISNHRPRRRVTPSPGGTLDLGLVLARGVTSSRARIFDLGLAPLEQGTLPGRVISNRGEISNRQPPPRVTRNPDGASDRGLALVHGVTSS